MAPAIYITRSRTARSTPARVITDATDAAASVIDPAEPEIAGGPRTWRVAAVEREAEAAAGKRKRSAATPAAGSLGSCIG